MEDFVQKTTPYPVLHPAPSPSLVWENVPTKSKFTTLALTAVAFPLGWVLSSVPQLRIHSAILISFSVFSGHLYTNYRRSARRIMGQEENSEEIAKYGVGNRK
eukprot:CAMPEP_0184337154 /NCGR_PEP_ID=MMETSP1089-20130417/5500_1 /TAXON_ID=38269 ORGANISM="Gloeochaete wittrockiana, Strain SAG46.84" /NCGR_SAMPLE_ID=MMETSP1089 /ASSEMBLY_ACC=CAM_ASM_000445 /LENGTH=102 /DNA_ID=CAMNT_0026662645 /DNA_START=35 /DNA_END=343 /DNA_ORIENTATION=-